MPYFRVLWSRFSINFVQFMIFTFLACYLCCERSFFTSKWFRNGIFKLQNWPFHAAISCLFSYFVVFCCATMEKRLIGCHWLFNSIADLLFTFYVVIFHSLEFGHFNISKLRIWLISSSFYALHMEFEGVIVLTKKIVFNRHFWIIC